MKKDEIPSAGDRLSTACPGAENKGIGTKIAGSRIHVPVAILSKSQLARIILKGRSAAATAAATAAAAVTGTKRAPS